MKVKTGLDLDNNKITSLGAPSADGDAANKGYVDNNFLANVDIKTGTGTFVATEATVTIAHGLGRAPVHVSISPTGTAGKSEAGYLGEVWSWSDATNIYVYSTGTGTAGFTWLVF
jgi:hypothetical protein